MINEEKSRKQCGNRLQKGCHRWREAHQGLRERRPPILSDADPSAAHPRGGSQQLHPPSASRLAAQSATTPLARLLGRLMDLPDHIEPRTVRLLLPVAANGSSHMFPMATFPRSANRHWVLTRGKNRTLKRTHFRCLETTARSRFHRNTAGRNPATCVKTHHILSPNTPAYQQVCSGCSALDPSSAAPGDLRRNPHHEQDPAHHSPTRSPNQRYLHWNDMR